MKIGIIIIHDREIRLTRKSPSPMLVKQCVNNNTVTERFMEIPLTYKWSSENSGKNVDICQKKPFCNSTFPIKSPVQFCGLVIQIEPANIQKSVSWESVSVQFAVIDKVLGYD